MEKLSSRQNSVIRHVRELAKNADLRKEEGCFLCDGDKLLEEALRSGAKITRVFWKKERGDGFPDFPQEYCLTEDLFDYISPLKNSPGPLFQVELPELQTGPVDTAIILEGVQDPGNVGTVLRTADAFGIDCVVLLEECADLYAPKTVRASMGAIFRQRVFRMNRENLPAFCRENGLLLYGAVLSDRARDLRELSLRHAAVAVGSEGRGLSRELRNLCQAELLIPMRGNAESLNAAVAASLIMWEMQR